MAPRLLLPLLLLLFVLRLSGSEMLMDTENAAGRSSQISRSEELTGGGGSVDCGGLCGKRCKLSSRPRLCGRACGTCCGRCNCVPPGTSGNYEACPYYANITTHGGRRKCP
ncbi:gibberellin-regulated protein 1-like [Zingiber officinale]|uniref:gibberellin-regulated protein 1-like n=1 Tax=Zingiber officinale TaxID=94328 RepID=UPI001C4D254F|nr:gibberellin-regulated protein 1-like [Zingiber officinale]